MYPFVNVMPEGAEAVMKRAKHHLKAESPHEDIAVASTRRGEGRYSPGIRVPGPDVAEIHRTSLQCIPDFSCPLRRVLEICSASLKVPGWMTYCCPELTFGHKGSFRVFCGRRFTSVFFRLFSCAVRCSWRATEAMPLPPEGIA